MPIDVQISLVGRRQLTREIYRQLRAAIVDGRLGPGERLPPTRELALRLAVARTTIMALYDRLLSEGFTEARVGRGTFVASDVPPRRHRTPTPACVLTAAAKFVTDWHSPLPTQRALASFLRDGAFARHVRRMRGEYRDRHDVIVATLRRNFADELRVIPSAAGVHLATLATRRSAAEIDEVIDRAAGAGVGLQATAAFAVDHEPRPAWLFGYGGTRTEHIEEGLARLRASFDAV